ncbi:zinc-ribbon domain-containing protein [Caproiciproducens galactitolivorans]|nr:zinc-ribbon domain-containing protein [Caproiciproducens galactitolivorans]
MPGLFYKEQADQERNIERKERKMKCKSCGCEIPNSSNFCPKCGIKIASVCNCWVIGEPYNCGQDECLGRRLNVLLEEESSFEEGHISRRETLMQNIKQQGVVPFIALIASIIVFICSFFKP